MKNDLGTELCVAVFKADPDRVAELLEIGADVNAVADSRVASVSRETPIWVAIEGAGNEISPEWADFCEALSDVIPRVQRRDLSEKRARYVLIARMLINAGADLETLSHGSTPLRIAVFGSDTEMVALLLESGANPNAETFSVLSKLARREGRKTLPGFYDTVLHEAVAKGVPAIVEKLLQAGADPTRVNHEGMTPLDIAREKGNTEIATLLELIPKKGAKTADSRFGNNKSKSKSKRN